MVRKKVTITADGLIRKGLTSTEANVLSDFVSNGKTVFKTEELAEKLGSPIKARQMAFRLVKKRWLDRLSRGFYMILELGVGSEPKATTASSYYIASKLTSPYYIGYYNVLNNYGWTEQIPLTIYIATTNKSTKESYIIGGVHYKIIKLSEKKFFGTITKVIDGHAIVISDPEKTIIDALDHPRHCGGISEVSRALYNAHAHKQLDWKKVLEYAEKLGNGAVFKRLGYLVEILELELPDDFKKSIEQKITTGYSRLDPEIKTSGKLNSRWNLIINAEILKEQAEPQS